MGKCLVVKLPGEVTDTSLRKLGEVIFDVIPRGDGSDFTEVRIQVGSNTLPLPIVSLTNGGKVYKTKDGAPLDQLELVWVGNSNNTFYIRTNGTNECKLRIENALNIIRLGYGFDTEIFSRALSDNSPHIRIPLDENIRVLGNVDVIYHSNKFSGDLAYVSYLPKLRMLMMDWTGFGGNLENIKSNNLGALIGRGTFLKGDISVLFKNCPKITTFQVSTYGTPISYLGDGTKLTEATVVTINIGNTLTNTEASRQLGGLIKALSKCTFRDISLGGGSVVLKGNETLLNVDEQTALSVLRTKATVTISLP